MNPRFFVLLPCLRVQSNGQTLFRKENPFFKYFIKLLSSESIALLSYEGSIDQVVMFFNRYFQQHHSNRPKTYHFALPLPSTLGYVKNNCDYKILLPSKDKPRHNPFDYTACKKEIYLTPSSTFYQLTRLIILPAP